MSNLPVGNRFKNQSMVNREEVPKVNAGSMADIAFLLLIFFLVTTSIETDVGLARMLPIINSEPPLPISVKNIFPISINSDGELLVDNELTNLTDLRSLTIDFLDNGGALQSDSRYCSYCQGERNYKKFGSFLGLGFLVGISVVVGFMLCFIPGIYLMVPLSLAFSILVFNNKGASDAYSDSFGLVKDEWWITFATIFVVGIIVGIANYAFAIPTQIYQFAKMGILSGEVDAESMTNIFQDPVFLILNMISTLAQFLLNLISVIAGAFIYFNLNEKKNFTGTYERIQDLGETPEK